MAFNSCFITTKLVSSCLNVNGSAPGSYTICLSFTESRAIADSIAKRVGELVVIYDKSASLARLR